LFDSQDVQWLRPELAAELRAEFLEAFVLDLPYERGGRSYGDPEPLDIEQETSFENELVVCIGFYSPNLFRAVGTMVELAR
jgi:hypothetical protein